MKHFQSFQTFSEKMKVANETKKIQEKEGQQKAYADFFMKLLQKYDVTSPDQLDDSKKKQFFDDVAKGWQKDSGVTDAGKEMVGESLVEDLEPELLTFVTALSVEERNGFLGTYHSARRENKETFEFKGKVYEIKKKVTPASTSIKVNETTINEKDITNDDDFTEYAKEILKAKHKDEYDETKAMEVIKDLLAKKEGDDYGKLVGILQNS